MATILSFDIGYASIGWCVLSSEKETGKDPEFLGTGVVTFPTDDCLASARRNLRRTRRHIRSTRQRIERMKRWLVHRGVLSRADLDKPGHPAPFLLAAAALQGHHSLNAWELWTVLRWYAHNRGYDRNSRWSSREQEEEDDTQKVSNARAFMKGYDSLEELRKALGPNAPESLMPAFHTMAETVCACLKLDPAKSRKTISSNLPYKTLNTAYPREIVQGEVLKLLERHQDKIPGLDAKTLDLLFTPESLSAEDRDLIKAADIKLPKRYHGGLLFGQLKPRFNNRIISRCPITWAKVYDLVSAGLRGGENAGEKWHEFVVYTSSEESRINPQKSHAFWEKLEKAMASLIATGKTKEEAVRQIAAKTADKFAKVPAAKSKEFLDYRFSRVLANIKANGAPIDNELRLHLFNLAVKQGRLTHADIKKAVKQHCGDVSTNLEACFKLHPDSEEALVLDPVMDEVRKAEGSQARLSPFWKHLTGETKEAIIDEWRNGRSVSLAWITEKAGEIPALAEALRKEFSAQKPKKGGIRYATLNEYLQGVRIGPKIPSGRAPYARPVLRQVVEEVKNGWDATKANKTTDPEGGEDKPTNGILYDLGIPGSRVRQLQNERPLDHLTNNHLVRHRMLILKRLVDDLVDEFGINTVSDPPEVFIEVARELKEFSGKDIKAIKTAEAAKLAQHKAAERRLIEKGISPTYSLIRKCRIAMDLNWTCPFTQRTYGESELSELQFEHIIPRSKRLSDSMAGLVLTRPEINALKGNRTARQFVLDHADDDRIVSPEKYKKWVESLRVARKESYPDDYARQSARRRLLMIEAYEEKERTFTEGQLTQTSHLMRLAVGAIRQKLGKSVILPIPGSITAEVRKGWNLMGTLKLACPEIETQQGEIKLKDEIRKITHLHHALDAATIALIAHFFPLNRHGQNQTGKLWLAMRKRNRSTEEEALLHSTRLYKKRQNTPESGNNGKSASKLELIDLEPHVKNKLSHSLAQCRVAQHLPSDRSGAKTKLTTWGVVSIEGEGEDARVKLRQNSSTVENGIRKRIPKDGEERAGKLLGIHPKQGRGKLKAIKGVMMIGENYGLALDPAPTVIPFHDVTARLTALRKANDGKPVRVLRNGMLIRIDGWPSKEGIWRIMSCKASLKLDLARPQETKASWREVAITSLLARGLAIIPKNYAGHPRLD